MNERIDLDFEALELSPLGSLPYSNSELERMNDRFAAAMAAAIRSGLEHPPRIGIDTTPGTKNPICYVRTPR
jgi:hypothetical protein